MLPETLTPAPLRIRFAKRGALKFISHLDLLRTMQAGLLRARIPVWYTEGFNPHPKMVFALPLSLGAESECELLDIRVTRSVDPAAARDALRAAFAPGLDILEVYAPDTKFTAIGWSRYVVTTPAPIDTSPLEAPALVVTKKSKSGEKEVDIRPMIRDFAVENSADGAPFRLILTLRAHGNDFLNPALVADTLGAADYTVTRTAVLDEDGKDFR